MAPQSPLRKPAGTEPAPQPIEYARRASPSPDRSTTTRCPYCAKRLCCKHSESFRVPCPKCRKRIIILIDAEVSFSARKETTDTVARMICDWLVDGEEEDDVHSYREYKQDPCQVGLTAAAAE